MQIQEYQDNDVLICPYCEFEFMDWWEMWPSGSEPGDEVEIKCEDCNTSFLATFHFVPSFDVREKE